MGEPRNCRAPPAAAPLVEQPGLVVSLGPLIKLGDGQRVSWRGKHRKEHKNVKSRFYLWEKQAVFVFLSLAYFS